MRAEERAETAGACGGAPCAPQTATPLNAPPRLIGGSKKNLIHKVGSKPKKPIKSNLNIFPNT